MRLALQLFVCFACACLLGTLSRWIFIHEDVQTNIPPLFTPSALHGQALEKEGPISLVRWMETYSFSDKTAFPTIDRLLPEADVMLGTQCTSNIQYEERLVWTSDEGAPFGVFAPEMESRIFEPWLLTLRNIEDVLYGWRASRVFSIVWNPYVRFVAAFERFQQYLEEEDKEPLSFSQFCRQPLSICQTIDADACWDMVQTAPSYTMAQTLCTFNENLHPTVDYVLDAAKLVENSDVPAYWQSRLSKETVMELQFRFQRVSREYQWVEGKAERLYRENPICLQSVYTFYHSDFLLLKYPKLALF